MKGAGTENMNHEGHEVSARNSIAVVCLISKEKARNVSGPLSK
jgi:hypothetical protein